MCVLTYVCLKYVCFILCAPKHTNIFFTPTKKTHQQISHTNNFFTPKKTNQQFSSTNKIFFTPKQNVGFTPEPKV